MLAILTVNVNDDFAINNDNGSLTLREAIAVVNGNYTPNPNINGDILQVDESADPLGINDTIVFASGLNGATITLNEGITGSTAGRELTITDSVTIDATALVDGLTIAGTDGLNGLDGTGDGSRVFRVNAGSGDAVTLAGLTITGGDVNGSGGGIVYNESGHGAGNLTIRNSVIRDNYATGEGGGFFARANTTAILTIVDSVISGNQAGFSGGGVAIRTSNDVVFDITRSTIEDNIANGNLGGGGGVFVDLAVNFQDSAEFNLTDSTIANNTATNGNGGGLWVCPKYIGTFNATNSTISGNQASANTPVQWVLRATEVAHFALAV